MLSSRARLQLLHARILVKMCFSYFNRKLQARPNKEDLTPRKGKKYFCREVELSIICVLETKIDAGNNVYSIAKVGNIKEECTRDH